MTITGNGLGETDPGAFDVDENAAGDDLDAELADFDEEDDGFIVGESAHILYDDETGETRLLVPVVIDEHGATTEVHVSLDARAMADLVAGIKEARSVQRQLDGLPPLERAAPPAAGAPELDSVDDEDRRPWTRWTAGRRGIDPAGLTAIAPTNNKLLWIVAIAVVLSIIAALAM